MTDTDDKEMEQTKRIMERLLKTPPDPKTGKGEKKGEASTKEAKPSPTDRYKE